MGPGLWPGTDAGPAGRRRGVARRRWEKSRDADEAYLDELIWNRIWARAVADSGIPFKPTAYQLRHTHASWLIDAGENPKAVMHRLGQADLRTTARYVHVLTKPASRPPGGLKGYCRLCKHQPQSVLSPLTTSRDDARICIAVVAYPYTYTLSCMSPTVSALVNSAVSLTSGTRRTPNRLARSLASGDFTCRFRSSSSVPDLRPGIPG